MSYKDDLRKLREEAGIDPNDPKYSPTPPVPEKPEKEAEDEADSASASFTPEERKMSLWQKISLPFVRSSIGAVLFFLLISLVWIAITHTVVASLRSRAQTPLSEHFSRSMQAPRKALFSALLRGFS